MISPPVVAIVDDEPDFAVTLASMLELHGFECTLHQCANTLRHTVADAHYCAIFLDLSLPDTDGIELFDFLAESGITVPLILMSGHSPSVMEAAKTIARQKGLPILCTLSKPIRAADIAPVLRLIPCHPIDVKFVK